MKSTFRDYIENNPRLNESLSAIGIASLTWALRVLGGISILSLIGLGSSWIFTAWGKSVVRTVKKTRSIWKSFGREFTDEEVEEKAKKIANSSEAKKQAEKIEKTEEKYSGELGPIYDAIEKKDWKEASEKFKDLTASLQDNPDIIKAIINKISEVNNEPPLYTNSPGNETYQAIKKIINIRTAKAAAEATKKALE